MSEEIKNSLGITIFKSQNNIAWDKIKSKKQGFPKTSTLPKNKSAKAVKVEKPLMVEDANLGEPHKEDGSLKRATLYFHCNKDLRARLKEFMKLEKRSEPNAIAIIVGRYLMPEFYEMAGKETTEMLGLMDSGVYGQDHL